MSRFLSARFNNLTPYTPGEQPQQMQYIKLNTNESPFAPSKKVIKAINRLQVKNLRLYSDPTLAPLINAVAKHNSIKAENVMVGNGSDEILAFSFLAFSTDKPIAMPDISYGFYPVFAKLYDVQANIIPLNESFEIDVNNYLQPGQNVVIANPNAPTGKALCPEQIEVILKAHPDDIVLIDEAYVDFGAQSAVSLIGKYNNLLVVQTFSKSRNLAGARIGMALADKQIIDDLNRIKFSFNPYNVNRLSMCAGIQAMQDEKYFKSCTSKIIQTRINTAKQLQILGFDVMDSKANFLFAKSNKISGEDLYKALKQNGVLVRWFDVPRIKDYVRITIGSKQEMQIFFEKLQCILNS